MNTQIFTQAAQLIKNAQNIVLMPHAKMDCDGMSASIALYLLLKKLGKNPTAVCPDPVPEAFDFLPSSEVFDVELPDHSSEENGYMITVDTGNKGFKDLKYTVQDGKVNIMIFSELEPLEESDFSFVGQNFAPDLIITLDSGDTKQLGKIYIDNQDLFEQVPVINIDHHVSNTQFGDVNVVDFKSSSTTELVYKLAPYITENSEDLIDENIATLLLAGMLTDTGSFQHANTTPASLDIAAELIEKGARHQEIVKHLFKTKSLATLRVWGRILTKLKNDPVYRMVWSSVSSLDLEETQAHSDETEGLIDELMATTPGTELVLLVKEREDDVISTSIRSSDPSVNSIEFAQKFGGGGHRQAAGFKIRDRGGKTFEEIVSDIIFEAKKFQADRLGVQVPKRDLISSLPLPEQPQEDIVENHQNSSVGATEIPEFPIPETPEEHVQNSVHPNESVEQVSSTVMPEEEDFHSPNPTENIPEPLTESFDTSFEAQSDLPENPQYIAPENTVNILTPEEQAYLNAPEYQMPEPEKEIEKKEYEESYIDDFADFISQAEHDEYQKEVPDTLHPVPEMIHETPLFQNPVIPDPQTASVNTLDTPSNNEVMPDTSEKSQEFVQNTSDAINNTLPEEILNPSPEMPQEDAFLRSLREG